MEWLCLMHYTILTSGTDYNILTVWISSRSPIQMVVLFHVLLLCVYMTLRVSQLLGCLFSQPCFVYLSNYPFLIPLKQWLAGILLSSSPRAFDLRLICICWQSDRKGGAQIPDMRAGRVMNEGWVYLYSYLASPFPDQLHVTASQSKNRRNLLVFLLPRTQIATDLGIYFHFSRLGRSCHLKDHALSLSVGSLCFLSFVLYPAHFWSHYPHSTYCHPVGHTHCCVTWSFWYSTETPFFV